MKWFKPRKACSIVDLNENDTLIIKYPPENISFMDCEKISEDIKKAASSKGSIFFVPSNIEFAILRNNHWFNTGEGEKKNEEKI